MTADCKLHMTLKGWQERVPLISKSKKRHNGELRELLELVKITQVFSTEILFLLLFLLNSNFSKKKVFSELYILDNVDL